MLITHVLIGLLVAACALMILDWWDHPPAGAGAGRGAGGAGGRTGEAGRSVLGRLAVAGAGGH
jgi:hypothetical protein